MVLGVPILKHFRVLGYGSTALAVGVGEGCLDIFLSSVIFLFFLPLSVRWPNLD